MRKALLSILLTTVLLSGCASAEMTWGEIKSDLQGRTAIVETFDEGSQLIDHIEGVSIDMGAENKFNTVDSEGNVTSKSGVLSITVGGKSMVHVGSSLIMKEQGLEDRFREFATTVDISNLDPSTPIVDRMVNSMKNSFTGQSMLILVRSQSGMPLAAFAGNKVSYFSTDIDKSTAFLVDGKYLFIYRCDYTIYDMSLIMK
ncbi:hypothetical protein D1872_51750 [compost metagenome]